MRVIAGIARGNPLKTEEGRDIRPTTDRVKESLFSIIQNYLEGARVLDLFCGSGALGIEALSRGSKFCIFVDARKDSLKVAKENLEKTKLFSRSELCCSDYAAFLKRTHESFDLILLDPPYKKNILPDVLFMIDSCKLLSDNGIIVCESHADDFLEEEYGELVRLKSYRYSSTVITTFKRQG